MRQIEFYKYTDAKSSLFCHQKLRESNICVYVEPSVAASSANSATVVAALAAVGAAIAAVAAAATATVFIAAMIAVSAAAIAVALLLIVVCPCCCLCFHLLPQLPAPAIATVVCRRHCHCCRRPNRCPCSFRHHRCSAASIFPPPLPLFPLPPDHHLCFWLHCHHSFCHGSYHWQKALACRSFGSSGGRWQRVPWSHWLGRERSILNNYSLFDKLSRNSFFANLRVCVVHVPTKPPRKQWKYRRHHPMRIAPNVLLYFFLFVCELTKSQPKSVLV